MLSRSVVSFGLEIVASRPRTALFDGIRSSFCSAIPSSTLMVGRTLLTLVDGGRQLVHVDSDDDDVHKPLGDKIDNVCVWAVLSTRGPADS